MATQRTVIVDPAGGQDFSTANSAGTTMAADYSLAGTLGFDISASSSTRIAAGSGLTALPSGGVGTAIYVNAAKTFIAVKGITVAFASGDAVTGSDTNTCTLSSNGVAIIIGIQNNAGQQTTAINFSGFTFSAANYGRCYAATGAEATMPYNTAGARLEWTSGTGVTYNAAFWRFERMSFKYTAPASNNNGQGILSSVGSGGVSYIIKCYIKGVMHASNTSVCRGGRDNTNGRPHLLNTVLEGWSETGNTGNLGWTNAGSFFTITNCLFYKCAKGVVGASSSDLVRNCLFDHAGQTTYTNLSGTLSSSCNYNSSSDATAGGAQSWNSQTFTYANAGTLDLHLTSADTGAKGRGLDMSADATDPFSDDFDGLTRSATWDIGPFKIPSAAGLVSRNMLVTQAVQRASFY